MDCLCFMFIRIQLIPSGHNPLIPGQAEGWSTGMNRGPLETKGITPVFDLQASAAFIILEFPAARLRLCPPWIISICSLTGDTGQLMV